MTWPPLHARNLLLLLALISLLSCSCSCTALISEHNINATNLQTGDNAVTDRMGDNCSKDDIVVYQGATAPLPNGIPTYTVQILNVCLSGCAVSDIHVSCGWFSSARLINPRVFRRIGFDDCLVNDGAALGPGQSLSFQYANTYRYPLYVSSVSCYRE